MLTALNSVTKKKYTTYLTCPKGTYSAIGHNYVATLYILPLVSLVPWGQVLLEELYSRASFINVIAECNDHEDWDTRSREVKLF